MFIKHSGKVNCSFLMNSSSLTSTWWNPEELARCRIRIIIKNSPGSMLKWMLDHKLATFIQMIRYAPLKLKMNLGVNANNIPKHFFLIYCDSVRLTVVKILIKKVSKVESAERYQHILCSIHFIKFHERRNLLLQRILFFNFYVRRYTTTLFLSWPFCW